jgi:hypothetical protein
MSVLAAVRKGDALAPGGSPTPMHQIIIKTPNPKVYLKRDLTAGPPSPPIGFCLGW